MSRIRSIKPEWLDDEHMAMASPEARVLSIALIVLADDYGNGRAGAPLLLGRVFPSKPIETLTRALDELVSFRYVRLYDLDGQRYFSIRKWSEHQRVDKPGAPKVPGPPPLLIVQDDSGSSFPEKPREDAGKLPESPDNPPASRASSPTLFSLSAPSDLPEKSGSARAGAGARSKPQASDAVPKPLAADWTPSAGQVAALAAKFSVSEPRILALVPEFRVFWRETRVGARKTLRGWAQAFGQNVDRLALRGTLFAGSGGAVAAGGDDPEARRKRAAEVEARAKSANGGAR